MSLILAPRCDSGAEHLSAIVEESAFSLYQSPLSADTTDVLNSSERAGSPSDRVTIGGGSARRLPDMGWLGWAQQVPPRTWAKPALLVVLGVILSVIGASTFRTSSNAVEQSRALSRAYGELVVLGDALDTVKVSMGPKEPGTTAAATGAAFDGDRAQSDIAAFSRTLGLVIDNTRNRPVDQVTVQGLADTSTDLISAANDLIRQSPANPLAWSAFVQRSMATDSAISELLPEIAAAQRAVVADARTSRTVGSIAVLGAPLTILLGSVLLLLGLNHRNRNEIDRLGLAMRSVGAGPNDQRLRSDDGPIHAALADDFAEMIVDLKETVTNLEAQARRSDIGRFIAQSMDSVRSRGDLANAVTTAFTTLDAGLPMEMMLTSPDESRMLRVASNSEAGAPGCPVASPVYCPALRSSSPLVFADSEAPDACPNLRGRGTPCTGVCVPVRNQRGSVGVLHATSPGRRQLDRNLTPHLVSLAALTGAKLAQIASYETTLRQATTDQLTGLANRKAFEERARAHLSQGKGIVLVMADLDHFKRLNDTFGHDIGDDVLRSFSAVVRENIRRSDVAARHGGEEFLILLADTSMTEALVTLDRIRAGFTAFLEQHGLPNVTASFGVTRSAPDTRLEQVIRIADAGLYLAKNRGRDRVVQADANTIEQVFGEGRATTLA